MRLRTVTGTRWPAKCADGCGAVIPPSPNVKVVVDFESHPRKTWIPEHSPDAGTWKTGNGASAPAPPSNGGNGHPGGFAPASALPAQPQDLPKAPEPPAQPKAPAPAPLALLGSAGVAEPSPSANAGVAWANSSLTYNAGAYESVKSAFADYAQPGESPEALRARVNRVVLEDLERSVRAMRELHERLGDTAIRTLSPARAAGAPKGASAVAIPSSPPSVATARAPPAMGETPSCQSTREAGVGGGAESSAPSRTDSPVSELVRRALSELVTDVSVKRRQAKDRAAKRFCELRGFQSLRQCGSADIEALEALLRTFGRIDDWSIHAAYGVPAPQLEEATVLPA